LAAAFRAKDSVVNNDQSQDTGVAEPSTTRPAAAQPEAISEALPGAAPGKPLSPAALRALAEAAERRAAIDAKAAELASKRELDGRGGLDPVRYDDWEIKGLTADF
jgi:hypothetical protein